VALHGQAFTGYVTAGANANQINGDDLAGYNRLGAFAGIGVLSDISDRWRWSLTIAYSQHGSRASAREGQRMSSPFMAIALDYVAVPVNIHYMDWLSDDETYYRLEFLLGVEYHRLINSKVTSLLGDDLTDQRPYSANSAALTAGGLYSWSYAWAAGIHYQRGILDAQALDAEQRQSIQQLSFRLRRTF